MWFKDPIKIENEKTAIEGPKKIELIEGKVGSIRARWGSSVATGRQYSKIW